MCLFISNTKYSSNSVLNEINSYNQQRTSACMELTRQEEESLAGKHGYAMELAYRVLVATGKSMDAIRLGSISWAHLSGVNYNTIGDAGERFLADLSSSGARVSVMTTLNPMGYDSQVEHGLDDNFVQKQQSIAESYKKMGVKMSFSCVPYDIFDMPTRGTRVAFAESNAAIFANSVGGLSTNKESAFSALASALTGKTPITEPHNQDNVPTVRLSVKDPSELDYALMGYYAGQLAEHTVNIADARSGLDHRKCKSMCAGMGTSGTCSKFVLDDKCDGETIDFDDAERKSLHDELSTAESGDMITLGSPQLGAEELGDLAKMLKGKSFKKKCLVFCPRAVQESATSADHITELRRAGCELLSDCCTCLTPLVSHDDVDSVTTNSVKGAYYLSKSNKVGVDLRSLADIVESETR